MPVYAVKYSEYSVFEWFRASAVCVLVSVSSRYQLYVCLQSTTVYGISVFKQLKNKTNYDSFVSYIAESKAEERKLPRKCRMKGGR